MLQPPVVDNAVTEQCSSLVVFDEVNDMLKQGKQPASEFFTWKTANRKHHLRIHAASPDGLRETAASRTTVLFFELRPPPALHIAAVLSAAPDFMLPALRLEGNMRLDSLVALCKQFSSNMRQLTQILSRAQVQTHGKLGAADTEVSANEFLLAMQRAGKEVYRLYTRELSGRMQKPLTPEHKARWSGLSFPSRLDGGNHNQSMGMAQKHLSNASLLVRERANQRRGPTRFVGAIAAYVMQQAVRQLLAASAEDATATAVLQALCPAGRVSGEEFEEFVANRLYLRSVSPRVMLLQELEQHAAAVKPHKARAGSTIVHFPAPSRNQGKLVMDTPLRGILWSGEPSGSEADGQFVHFHHNSKLLKVDAAALRSINTCKTGPTGGVTIINTAHSAPFCDFVVYRHDGQQHHQVTFVEATISTLAVHSSDKTASKAASACDPLLSSGGGAAAAGQHECVPLASKGHKRAGAAHASSAGPSKARKHDAVGASPRSSDKHTSAKPATTVKPMTRRSARLQGATSAVKVLGDAYNSNMVSVLQTCPASLRDALSLLGLPMYRVDRSTDTCKLIKATSSDREAVSVVNAWLDVLGAPLLVRVNAGQVGETHRYGVETVPLPGKEESAKKWSVSVVYISNAHLRDQSTKNVSWLKSDMVYCLSAQHLDLLSKQPISAPSSPEEGK
jgi:hypothetical protein